MYETQENIVCSENRNLSIVMSISYVTFFELIYYFQAENLIKQKPFI